MTDHPGEIVTGGRGVVPVGQEGTCSQCGSTDPAVRGAACRAILASRWHSHPETRSEFCECGDHIDEHCDNSRFAEVGSIIGPCQTCECKAFVAVQIGSTESCPLWCTAKHLHVRELD